MPSSTGSLRDAAARADHDAAAAREIARDLDRRHSLLEHRLTPVLQRHRSDVWASQAASASRLRLQIGAAGELDRARAAIAELAGQLRRRADQLETLAVDYRREADLLDDITVVDAAPAAVVSPQGFR